MSQSLTNSNGTVLPFRPDMARVRRPIAGEEARGAILFFTGIRYERQEGEMPKAKRRSRPRPEEA